MKIRLVAAILVLVMGLANSLLADTYWQGDDTASPNDWYVDENWDTGAVPTSSDGTYIESLTSLTWPVINGDTANTGDLRIAYDSDTLGELTVTGGAVLSVTGELRIARKVGSGQAGKLYISGETTTINIAGGIECGRHGDGTIEMTGGTVIANGELVIAYRNDGAGHVQLDGGTLRAGGLDMRFEGAMGTMDIAGGTLVLAGQWDQSSKYFKEDGWIVAHGGDEGWSLYFHYNGSETTIKAIGPGFNLPPTVDAGEDKTLTLPDATVQLDGTVTDDGIGDPNGYLDITWSVQSRPDGSIVYFDNNKVEDPTVTFDTVGEYVLFLYATDGEKGSGDIVTVTVYPEGYLPPLPPFIVTRLNAGEPIITEAMFVAAGATGREGRNINGPSIIRVPDWIAPENRADPSAVYYLYFAHHGGNYIRMAWAEHIEGPWHLYNIGSGVSVGSRSVLLDLGSDDQINIGNNITVYNHIASPDVHADDANQRIIIYFHGPTTYDGRNIGQRSFVATSSYGLDFSGGIEPVILGGNYFRVFEYGGTMYALDNRADVYIAPDQNDPWTPPEGFDFSSTLWTRSPNDPFENDLVGTGLLVRHTAVHLIGNTMQVFYSRIGDTPERIQMSTIDLSVGDCNLWDSTYPPEEILQAELLWEGGDILPRASSGGSAPENVNQLRDPHVFGDIDGRLYLSYCGRGEDAIGIARLEPVAAGDFNFDRRVDYHDLAILAIEWLYESGHPTADMDGDGKIDFIDFAVLAENWTAP